MKMLFWMVLFALTSGPAMATSYATCTATGGSEQGLAIAPDKFEVNEEGKVSLLVNTKKNARKMSTVISIEVGSNDAVYYGTKSIKLGVAAKKKVIGSGDSEVLGMERFEVQGCKDENSTTASYNFVYELKNTRLSTGSVTYQCECGLD